MIALIDQNLLLNLQESQSNQSVQHVIQECTVPVLEPSLKQVTVQMDTTVQATPPPLSLQMALQEISVPQETIVQLELDSLYHVKMAPMQV